MTGTIYIMKVLLCTASFLLLCVAAMKVNLNRTERARQFAMPGIALVYGVLALVFVSDLYAQIARLLAFLEERLPFVEGLHLNQYLIYLANAAIVLRLSCCQGGGFACAQQGVGRICGTDGDDVRPFL